MYLFVEGYSLFVFCFMYIFALFGDSPLTVLGGRPAKNEDVQLDVGHEQTRTKGNRRSRPSK